MERPIRILMVTTGWPTSSDQPETVHFIKRQAAFLGAVGVEVEVFYFPGLGSPLNYLRAWIRIQPRLRSREHDLVHAQWGQSALVTLPKRLPLVVTYRGGDLHGRVDPMGRQTFRGRILQWLCRVVARRADAVLLVSEHMKKFLDPGMLVHIIPSGIDFDLFRLIPQDEARRHLGLPLDRPLILFAGNPDGFRKRYALARQAVDLVSQFKPVELIVAWGRPHEDMPYLMNACDALVFTSMQEGSPNVVKEALACNLPVVSVPVGDVPERLSGVEGCELCVDDRPETIAAALERVLRRGGRCSGREAVASLNESLITQRLMAIYQSVLNGGQARRTPS